MEECVDECLGYINDLSENKPEGCAEATIEYYNCGLELSCADANSMFTDGEDADLSEDHACYTELVNSNNICNPLSPEEQIAGYCESLCAISMTCQEEDEEEEESEQSVEEEMGQCLMFCQAVYGSLVSRSSDCFDAFAELSECVADNEDCEMFGYEEEETEGACTDKITALDAVCCPMVIFADECEELCQHLNDCEADDYEECMEYCVAVNHLVAALDDEDCAAAYQAYTSCLMDAECSDLITEEEEEQVCDDERVAYDELCDNYT